MKNKILLTVLALILVLVLAACTDATTTSTNTISSSETTSTAAETKLEESTASTVDDQTEAATDKLLELIKPEQAKELLDRDQEILLLDVRTQAEYDEVHIPGSTLIPVEELSGRLNEINDWQDKTVIVYCRSGRRSAIAAKTLSDAGFSVVYDLGGIQNWPYETE